MRVGLASATVVALATLAMAGCELPPLPAPGTPEAQAVPVPPPRPRPEPLVAAPQPDTRPAVVPPPPPVRVGTSLPTIKPGDSVRRLTVSAAKRTYLLHVPTGYEAGTPRPLLIVLHGRGGSAAGARGWGFSTRADQKGWLVVYPEALPPTRSWSTQLGTGKANADDVAYLEAMLGDLALTVSLDPQRVYAVGYSTGGSFAAHLAGTLKAPSIAAVAIVGSNIATQTRGSTPVSVKLPDRAIPALFIHGRADRAAPFRGGPSILLDGANTLGASEGMALWARAAGCSENPVPTRLGAIEQLHHEGCAGGTRVELETHAGGHEWPRNLALDPRRGTPTVDHVMDFLEHGQTGSSARAGSAP